MTTVNFDQACGNFLEVYQTESGKFKDVAKFKAVSCIGWTSAVKADGKGGNPMVRISDLEGPKAQCRAGQLIRLQVENPKVNLLIDAEGNSLMGADGIREVAFQINADEQFTLSIDSEGTLKLHL
jgi:hypothetical protein